MVNIGGMMRKDGQQAPAVVLEAYGLCKAYSEGEKKHLVLQDVSLSLQEGELAVLVGRSGAGKSTLLNVLSGLDRPDAGVVRIGQTVLTALPEQERTRFRRQHLGFIFQAYNLIPTLTVEENVRLPLELLGRTDAAAQPRVQQLLEAVGLAERAQSFPDRLSGGEQQRVAIARALVHHPMVIFADEPTGNLDDQTAAQVVRLLVRLVRQERRTLLVVTHDQAFLPLADRIWELHEGRLFERTPECLSSSRLYQP